MTSTLRSTTHHESTFSLFCSLGHHFYDSLRIVLPATYPPGSKLRLLRPSPASTGPALPNFTCGVNGIGQRDCGFSGITWEQCVDLSCCFGGYRLIRGLMVNLIYPVSFTRLLLVPIIPNPNNSPWCYHPPPPPSSSPSPPPVEGNLTLTIDLVDLYLIQPPMSQASFALL